MPLKYNADNKMENNISRALKDWIPFRLLETESGQCCRWLYLGDETFDEPFFDETILKCRNLPQNARSQKSTSNTAMLLEWAPLPDSIAPAALIFHVSRCGSTLLSQLLSLNTAHIVLSEIPFFDELLRHGFKTEKADEACSLLKAAVAFYGAKRKPKQQRLFIKTDSWHIHFYDQWRKLYPKIPFILLYRRPDEVIRSQQRKKGIQAVPGLIEPGIFGFDKAIADTTDLDKYMADVLESYFRKFIQVLNNDPLAFPCNYNQGMAAVAQKVLQLSGIIPGEDEMEAFKQRCTYHGKYPGEVFNEAAITDDPPAYQQKVFQLYNAVEKIRTAGR